MKGINVLSCFDGISCGQVALERAGIKVNKYYSLEIDKNCIFITKKNFPNTIQLGDIKNINGNEFEEIDLIIAGTPCQDLSSFKQNAKGLKGDKSILFFEFLKILRELKPKYFLLENVKSMKKRDRDIISKELGVEPIEINSAEFSAQNRIRLYWTNITQFRWIVNNVKFKDILEDLHFREIPKCFFKKWGDKQRIDKGLNWVENEKANCLTTKNCHTNQYLLNKEKDKIRLLTAQEYEKLQTLPLGYTNGISDGERFKCMGNGWTIDVIAHLFKALSNQSPTSQTKSLRDFPNGEHNISLKD